MPSEVMEDIEDDIESRHDSYLSAFDASMNGTRSKEDLLTILTMTLINVERVEM